MAKSEKERYKIATKAASEWRSENQIFYGYVLIYKGRFHSFCEELPQFETRRNFPIAVDMHDNCFVVTGNDRQWDNLFLAKREKQEEEKEPIEQIAMHELCICYPNSKDEIVSWFTNRSANPCQKGMQKFERLSLDVIFNYIKRGISFDRFLAQ